MRPAATVIVDDHLLLRLLLGEEPPRLRARGAAVMTTGLWYHRLCRALALPAVRGALSSQLANTDPMVASAALQAVVELPPSIGLASLRDVAWPMAEVLRDGSSLNLLALEALAAAELHSADLCLGAKNSNPPLLAAARARGLVVRVIAP